MDHVFICKCGCEYYCERHIQAVTISFDQHGEPDGAGEYSHVRGGTKQYCLQCHKDVTNQVDGLKTEWDS